MPTENIWKELYEKLKDNPTYITVYYDYDIEEYKIAKEVLETPKKLPFLELQWQPFSSEQSKSRLTDTSKFMGSLDEFRITHTARYLNRVIKHGRYYTTSKLALEAYIPRAYLFKTRRAANKFLKSGKPPILHYKKD